MLSQALLCLALNVFFEAKGEPISGMEAVAQVTMTRAKNESSNVCKVVFEKKQFSWTAKHKTVKPTDIARKIPAKDVSWIQAKIIARKALLGKLKNRVGNAAFFYNPKKVPKPKWHNNDTWVIARIGNHVFLSTKLTKKG